VKPFADALVALQKGKYTPQPVQSPFGYHIIQLDDVRDAKVPSFDEVKPQLAQRLQGQVVEKHLAELRAKAGISKLPATQRAFRCDAQSHLRVAFSFSGDKTGRRQSDQQ
jgi:parvulin-like peptidyl-prolyl isomerase